MTDTRERIRVAIRTEPGVHFSELARSLDLATGQLQHHLRELQGREEVLGEQRYGQTHYYPPEYDAWERGALALLRRETAADIVAHLLERGPSRPDEVTDALGIARSTLEWHLDRLCDQGLVEKRREGNRVTLAAAAPERTAELLRRAEPTLPERLTDRFTRLVDSLLTD